MLAYLIASIMAGGATAFLAQAAEPGWAPIVNMGGVAAVLFWFMWKNEPRMRAMESSIDRLGRAHLIRLMNDENATELSKEAATAVVAEIDKAAKLRGE